MSCPHVGVLVWLSRKGLDLSQIEWSQFATGSEWILTSTNPWEIRRFAQNGGEGLRPVVCGRIKAATHRPLSSTRRLPETPPSPLPLVPVK